VNELEFSPYGYEPLLHYELPVCDDNNFKIYFLPVSVLLHAEKIPRHEDVLNELKCYSVTELRNCDVSQRSVFISHRWVGNSPDDEENSQFQYIKKALQRIDKCELMYIWIDYSCMKQDTPDLPTIRRLNYILSFAQFFMIVLPEGDPEGVNYTKRVWCIYEWLAVLHFKRTFILPSMEFSRKILQHTLSSLVGVLEEGVLNWMDVVRVQCGSRLEYLTQFMSNVAPGGVLSKEKFVATLQAYKEEDKEYVHENLSKLFNLLDLLFLYVVGSGKLGLFVLAVSDYEEGQISIPHLQELSEGNASNMGIYNDHGQKHDLGQEQGQGTNGDTSDSSLGRLENWREIDSDGSL